MNDWERLGRLLVARRVELGYKRRAAFARAHNLSHTRTIDDMENARRTNYERGTLAEVEQLYGWEPGSIESVLAGGEPKPRPGVVAPHAAGEQGRVNPSNDPAIQIVLDSDLPWSEKEELIATLIEERRQEEAQRVTRARRSIDLYRRAQGQ